MRVKLLTKDLLKKIPPLYSQENVEDPDIAVKFFTPDAQWTWFVTEGGVVREDDEGTDPLSTWDGKADVIFFGLVDGFEKELGYFTLSELQSIRGGLGLPIERDRFFSGKLSSVK